MHITNLRKVGGSVMLAVPPALLKLLNLEVGSAIGVAVEGEQLVIKATPKPRYTLEELLAASDYDTPLSGEEREWIDAPLVGKEIW
jgi:antitoxin ChpS